MPHSFSAPNDFLVCIAGPTGAGKTAAALALAERLPVSVINTDSRQVYRDFPIITAQPSEEERSRCPHLLYGFLPSEAKLGAGEYARMANAAIAETRAQGRLPVLVGGTGLYFKALLSGLAPIPDIPEAISAHWQQRCLEQGSPALHALLATIDPAYAAKIHPNDRQRVLRALEVHEATGKNLSWWHSRELPPSPYTVCTVGIGLPMASLEPLLARRIQLMLAAGAVEEAETAMRRQADPAAPGWSGIGCSELHAYLSGTITFDACLALWLKNTRAYAKRQNTWFRADKSLRWFTPEAVDDLLAHVLRTLQHAGA